MANKLTQSTYTTAWSPLIELHVPKGSANVEPFFCVHSLGANLVTYYKIASLLRGDRQVYGLQPHGLDGQTEPLDRVEEMASAYLKEIRKIQPHGPYYVGGICLGGVVAFEIAQQLRAAGQEVRLVLLIDSFLPGDLQYLHTRSALVQYLDYHLGEALLQSGAARLKYLARWCANGVVRLARSLGWQENGSLARATRLVREAHKRAVLGYTPKPYDGKITQLLCSDASDRSYEDRRLAWSTLAADGFEVRIVPGNHLTMVEEPYVRIVAAELQRSLDRASGVVSSPQEQSADAYFDKGRSVVAEQIQVEKVEDAPRRRSCNSFPRLKAMESEDCSGSLALAGS